MITAPSRDEDGYRGPRGGYTDYDRRPPRGEFRGAYHPRGAPMIDRGGRGDFRGPKDDQDSGEDREHRPVIRGHRGRGRGERGRGRGRGGEAGLDQEPHFQSGHEIK